VLLLAFCCPAAEAAMPALLDLAMRLSLSSVDMKCRSKEELGSGLWSRARGFFGGSLNFSLLTSLACE
jgi:hypothetical protein